MKVVRTAAKGLLFLLCCAADAFVLRSAWLARDVASGQFRRGYFESLDGTVGLTLDGAVRPGMIPSFLLAAGGALGVPPGMAAVAPLAAGVEYNLLSEAAEAPYVVIGSETSVGPVFDVPSLQPLPDEARLAGARTLGLRDGRLALVAWDAARPWRDDAARLAALRESCAGRDRAAWLGVKLAGDRIEVRFGRCALEEPIAAPPAPLLAALAGPEWLTVARTPPWGVQEKVEWIVLAIVVAKVAAMGWGLGGASALATSGVLALAALFLPVPAMLTWPVMGIVAAAAAAVRAAGRALRLLPRRARLPVALALLALLGGYVASAVTRPRSFPPVVSTRGEGEAMGACAVIGYSTVKGEGVRREHGGLRWLLEDECASCRGQTAALFAGGETLAWARDAYCGSPSEFGAGGQVAFLGGVNDDFFWGFLSLPRIFVGGRQGIEPWRRNVGPAAAASLERIDAQAQALEGLMRCALARRARFVFLHDFLVTDLPAGRDRDRAAMLERRRAVVEAGGGRFVDLLGAFGGEAGVAWFNDYVHLSLVAQRRLAGLACP
jgi:hypothetical protein